MTKTSKKCYDNEGLKFNQPFIAATIRNEREKAVTTERLFKKILIFEYIGFGIVILFLWLDEMIDIPYLLFGSHPTPVNYTESLFETAMILFLSLLVIIGTKRILGRIEHIAMYDALTDLVNRRFLTEYLMHKVQKPSRSKRKFSIIICDIDHFKKINDHYGHQCGDAILRQVADILKTVTRPQDLVSRWGGEEFLIFLPDMSSGTALGTAERLRIAISEHSFTYESYELRVTMSFGVSDHYYGGMESSRCLTQADQNLYEAKRRGRNRVV